MEPKRGRPKRRENLTRIYLKESTYELWNKRKDLLSIKRLTNSEFAELLLHRLEETEMPNPQPLESRKRKHLKYSGLTDMYYVMID